jgi:hypothetical protein
MLRIQSIWIISGLLLCAALAGCGGTNQFGSQPPSNGNPSVVLAMTDTPPSNVSILSAQVTLTGAMLNPGNIPLLPAPTMVELTRLQTDTAYLSNTTVNAGSYTSLTLFFANPLLTIENDTGSAIVSGATTCTVGSICTIAPTSLVNLSTTIALSSFSIASKSSSGLLVDVNLDNLLSSTMGADFKAGTTASVFTPAGTGAPLVGAEDVVGQVGTIDTTHNTFSFQIQSSLPPPNLTSLVVDSKTSFFNFPSGTCTTPSIQCLKTGQIVSVDIGIRADSTAEARNVLFEDADSSKTEVEAIITSTDVASQQFAVVTLAESAAFGGPLFGSSSGLVVGEPAVVHYTASTTFDVDFTHADAAPVDTSCCLFGSPTDLVVGQQVQIRSTGNVPTNSINADRVRLRSTRITATLQSNASSIMGLSNIPSIFSGHGVTSIQVHTLTGAICSNDAGAQLCANISILVSVSARGPLFKTGGTPGSPILTMIATRVAEKP